MSALSLQQRQTRSLGRHALLGTVSILMLLGGAAYWAASTTIAGAIVAGGSVVVDGGARLVQHQEGGIVRTILVRNEDAVAAGDLLIALDGTATAANLAVIDAQLGDALTLQARLLAESQGSGAALWSEALEGLSDRARNLALFSAQEQLRLARAATLENQSAQLAEQIAQFEIQIEGLEAQASASETETGIVSEQVTTISALFAQGLVERSRLADIERQLARLDGDRARTLTEIARSRAAISERTLQMTQLRETFLSDVLAQLQEAGQAIAELQQQKIAAEDRLRRLEIRAPIAGIVHESQVQTVGGVIGPGETLMQIVPQNETLLVDIRVSPLDRDRLATGQPVDLRLSGLDPRRAPELSGVVASISPDLLRDPVNGLQFYLVRVTVPEAEQAKLSQAYHLVPGMPVEAFFRTEERTVLAYLVAPAVTQLSRVFREE